MIVYLIVGLLNYDNNENMRKQHGKVHESFKQL